MVSLNCESGGSTWPIEWWEAYMQEGQGMSIGYGVWQQMQCYAQGAHRGLLGLALDTGGLMRLVCLEYSCALGLSSTGRVTWFGNNAVGSGRRVCGE